MLLSYAIYVYTHTYTCLRFLKRPTANGTTNSWTVVVLILQQFNFDCNVVKSNRYFFNKNKNRTWKLPELVYKCQRFCRIVILTLQYNVDTCLIHGLIKTSRLMIRKIGIYIFMKFKTEHQSIYCSRRQTVFFHSVFDKIKRIVSGKKVIYD